MLLTDARPAAPSAASPAAGRARWHRAALLDPLLLGTAAALVAAWHVGVPAIWRDEAASITAAERSWPALAATVAHVDVVHAAYYGLLHLWFAVLGYSPVTLRLPSVLAVGGAAAVVTVLGRRLASRRAGLAAGAASAVLPSLVWAGGEGRSYALSALLAALATLALVHALTPHRRRGISVLCWLAHAALLALTATVFLDGLLLAAAHAVTAALLLRRWGRLAGVASGALAALAVAPLLRLAALQTAQVDWISADAPASPWRQVAVEQWFRSNAVAATVLAILVVGVLTAVLRRRLPRRAVVVAVPWAVLPPAALLAAGLMHAPLYWPRYVTFTAPAVALLIGIAAAALPRLGTAAAVALLAVVAVPQIAADRQPGAKAHSELALAARLVEAERTPSDGPSGIVFGQYHAIPGMTTRIDAIAYPQAFRGLADVRALTPLTDSAALFGADRSPAAAVPRMHRLTTVWFLLDPQAEPTTPVPVAAMRAIGLRETGRFETAGSVLLRFGR
ncbi:MAG: hypothetical protein ACTHJL_02790 [Amnibacterium sp.]